jgi:hypothetical protein
MLNATATAQERFAQYRRIDAYEVRPDIVMMPRYTATNEICEIELERLSYALAHVRLNADLTRNEVIQTLDELVPLKERGKLLTENEGVDINGQTPIGEATSEYENVQIRIYSIPFLISGIKKGATMSPLVATVTWKNRKCR